MTRIDWLLKGDPLISLQAASRTVIIEPKRIPILISKTPDRFFSFTFTEPEREYPFIGNTKGTPQGSNDFMR